MSEMRKPSFWAVLPATVRYDEELRPNAKLLYAEITALADSTGYCWASNEYLSRLFGIAPRTVSDLVGTLGKRGYLTVEVVRDPVSNQVIERRIWVDKPAMAAASTPPAKNGDTPAGNGGTPTAKNGVNNNLKGLSSSPKPPKGRRQRKESKEAPDWNPTRFTAFWEYYRAKVRGEDKQAAIRAWDRLRPDDELITIMARALQRQMATDDWKRGVGIPYAATWLNNERWKDTPKAPVADGEARSGAAGPRVVVDSEEVPVW